MRTKIAVFAGITGGLIFLLFLFFGIGIMTDGLLMLASLLGTMTFTILKFLLLNFDGTKP